MKKILIAAACMTCCGGIRAQIVNPGNVARDAGTSRVNSNINSGVNNAADKLDNGIKGLFSKKKKDGETGAQAQQATPGKASGGAGENPSIRAYSNYDFVPGDRILFEDNFADDQDGEFPARWSLNAGQAVLNKMGGRDAFLLTNGNFARVSPLVKGKTYLSDTFTIEFDSYCTGGYGPHIYFFANTDDAAAGNSAIAQVNVNSGNNWSAVGVTSTANNLDLTGDYPADMTGEQYYNKWHHIAIAYRHNQLKVYIDQYRIITVPGLAASPRAFDIEGIGDANTPVIMSNFRVANGGAMNMYTKKFTEAKIVTHGINFDVDKSSIKPESMGTLNAIKSILTDNPGLRFEIDGHTDNSGATAHNLALSQQRAEAVKQQLMVMGIDAARLTTKGFGDSKPMSDNTTPEGKANNRRVEFIRL